MSEEIKEKTSKSEWFFRIMSIIIIMIVIYIVIDRKDCCMCGNTDNDCCPCPNEEMFDTIKEWCPDTISSAGSFKYCCDEYKKKFNETFECFE